MAGLSAKGVPNHLDGPALVGAASALMLIPSNASQLVRLHRLAALGMSMSDRGGPSASPSGIRAALKADDFGGPHVIALEDRFSEPLVRSVTFYGGDYLISGGSAEHGVADLENLIEAIFDGAKMPGAVQKPARRLVQALLTISDVVLKRAGLSRGTAPGGGAGNPIEVPGAAKLRYLAGATFISNDELRRHGSWLPTVIDTFAIDPGHLVDPCATDYNDDRLYETPFLRLDGGYRVALPLDLAITIRFHLLRYAAQEDALEQLARGWRDAALRRTWRSLPHLENPVELERSHILDRYLVRVDEIRDLHVIAATDPLDDWELEIWGQYDSAPALARIADLISPVTRQQYSTAEDLVHVILIDSPARGAAWGVPNIDGADPVLIMRSDDLEVILHHEPDELLGLVLFAQAIQRRPGRSMSWDIIDEYAAYESRDKSFYLSDDAPPDLIHFQAGDGLEIRLKHSQEVDRHGVAVPRKGSPLVQVVRRYSKDAPEVFVTVPNRSFMGCVVEAGDAQIFVGLDDETRKIGDAAFNLLDCVAFWVRECAVLAQEGPVDARAEITVKVDDLDAWVTADDRPTTGPAVHMRRTPGGFIVELTATFARLLQGSTNVAERHLAAALLSGLFGLAENDVADTLPRVAPLGSKRMITAMSQAESPDMLALKLPAPLTGHEQVTSQLLDDLGSWLRSPKGAGLTVGALDGRARTDALNRAVEHLFRQLESQVAAFDQRDLLDYLVIQNESLLYSAKLDSSLLKSRLACFGEQSETVAELVEHRTNVTSAHRANRFLIEYVAAQPPKGDRPVTVLDYFRLLAAAEEIINRGTTSDFLHHGLADFEVSILPSGRLGVSREEPVTKAIEAYARHSGTRAVREATATSTPASESTFDVVDFISRSEAPMRTEFGFSLDDLRAVSGALLDIAAADQVNRVPRSQAIEEISSARDLSKETVSAVLTGITLASRDSFGSVGPDAWPWRYNRNMSYVRRPIVLQDDELVFGFRSVYRLGPHWAESLMSGRLQSRAKTVEMQQFISEIRAKINDDFAKSVAARLQGLGMRTQTNAWKVGKHRIADENGNDLGDIDVLAANPSSQTLLAVEAKDFEIARTPVEIDHELEKLFVGSSKKKPTVALHGERIAWLQHHVPDALTQLGVTDDPSKWRVAGMIVTSEPLLTPLLQESPFDVVAFDDLEAAALLQSTESRPRRGRHPLHGGTNRRK